MMDEKVTFAIKVTQHSYLDTIKFKCPQAKKFCVSQVDRNGDGEVSYEEAATNSLTLYKSEIAALEITSFDEFRFFSFLSNDANLFEGTQLKSMRRYAQCSPVLKGMFKDCRNLEDLGPGGLVVEEEGCMNCTSLKYANAYVYGARAFMGCTALEEAAQHDTGLPDMAFKGCVNLQSFAFELISDDVSSESIGMEAFYGCEKLSELTVPRYIKTIGDRAFYGCASLKSITFSSSVPPTLGVEIFEGCSPDLKIYVPSPLVAVYKSNWPALSDKIVSDTP